VLRLAWNVAPILSLALAATGVAVDLRTRVHNDLVTRLSPFVLPGGQAGSAEWSWWSGRGTVVLGRTVYSFEQEPGWSWVDDGGRGVPEPPYPGRHAGFDFGRTRYGELDNYSLGRLAGTAVVFPTWAPPVVFSVLPAARLAQRLRRWARRQAPGRCRRCDYDLRATPGRCPECGTPAVTITT